MWRSAAPLGRRRGETTAAPQAEGSPELETASQTYEEYVVAESDKLLEGTERFADAVVSGDVEGAKELYAPTRIHWERIEPIAASVGDLDPDIDAREGDVPEEEWGGFHRIEQALWEENTTEGQEEYPCKLVTDVEALRGAREGGYVGEGLFDEA
ncbi:MAG: Ferrous iron transport periplasmic protein EfeO, contains peptidase-M75 domain and (frequently) cupredoxin-like domain [uncultured Rubrobacteraceae bacterium]|uniref:Ferrous iron transport periplasmic protein EfeO, contains peptidase-M75 domain and (Frequently) cupredoxin-like domain n=1 Tax=uncultured Rubrobacteraceae bacterium TaxID=349277 RepID=A0A6J4R4J2_9ACTN|nr:MAG: Ferrous iron transport periplasmic protein EfeO, contains peptidase-M75 domain and (frequently) cupredoxin-like domain [uncultured Rubrobacteraceae bacterium]